ncbi:PREDICTED: angiogenin, partial [Leptosomus discolor]|uniref:angiogenin n=1 Tax=Leptosomus discolor TaxID=188344 RepID=UPI0005225B25
MAGWALCMALVLAALSGAVGESQGLHITPTSMGLTFCRLRGGDTRPPCAYRARQLQHHVRVTCLNGLPVHLAGTHASP